MLVAGGGKEEERPGKPWWLTHASSLQRGDAAVLDLAEVGTEGGSQSDNRAGTRGRKSCGEGFFCEDELCSYSRQYRQRRGRQGRGWGEGAAMRSRLLCHEYIGQDGHRRYDMIIGMVGVVIEC